MPDGRTRRHPLDGVSALTSDGCVPQPSARGSSEHIPISFAGVRHPAPAPRVLRRFVRMLVLERKNGQRDVVITPPDHGAVAPNVVSLPEAPGDAAVIDT